MARIARVVIPHYPHHVTQRGNRKQQTFFSDEDYQAYIDLVASAKEIAGVEIWAYCLMPNHVHLVVVPESKHSLASLFRDAHRRYTRRINFREGWRGHLWQERFFSSVMDENYLLAAVRYVELNPVRAGLCKRPQDWPWSSTLAHMSGFDDALVTVAPMLERITNWAEFIQSATPQPIVENIQQHARTGRPLGCDQFLEKMEKLSGRQLIKAKSGPKGKS